jgi:hypothetical protein
VKLADALTRAGVKVDDELDPGHSDPANVACWVSTPTHATGWFTGQRTVISTMWEATRLPEAFRETLHNFDQVLVPSEQNRELFSRYHHNVAKVPLGVDTDEWKFVPRTAPTDRFVFLIGGSGARKGVDVAYKAFKKVFSTWPSDMPRPVLLFKSPRPIDFFGDRIEHIGGRVSDQDERAIYSMAHCYLQPSRGEGWGLQPLQAIAQGLPTILTDAHGHAEFADLGLPIGYSMSKADYFIYGDAGQWWEPSLDDLCQQMEWVYHNYDEATARAAAASVECHRRFSWDNCADAFVRAVGPSWLDADYEGDGTWAAPEVKRFLVRVARPWRCEIAGNVFQFVPGRDYWETADVKRILFEQDRVLDLSCVVADPNGPLDLVETGLAPEQLARLGDYSAAMAFCDHCGQKLGTGERWQPE